MVQLDDLDNNAQVVPDQNNQAAQAPPRDQNAEQDPTTQGPDTHGRNPSAPFQTNKHRSPDLVAFFNGLSFRSRLLWNKAREEKNDARDVRRIRAREDSIEDADISDNDSICSIASKDLEPLCDHDVYQSYVDALSNSVKVKVAILKRKHSHTAPGDVGADFPSPKRRKIDGKMLKPKDAGDAPVEIPEIYFSTEDEGAHLPLPLFHPEAIRHVATNLATIPLTRINPRPGEPKGSTILDIKKMTDLFGGELNSSFTYDRYMESVSNYLFFQSSRDASSDPFSGNGNGDWSRTWFRHFGFFSGKKDTGALYPFWKQYELELRQSILVEKNPFIEPKYDQLFLMARSNAETEANTKLLISEMTPPKYPVPSTSSSKQFFRQDRKQVKPGKRPPSSNDTARHGGFCLGCAREHTIFQHISNGYPNSFADGKQMFTRISEGKLLLPNGNEPCFIYNLSNLTNKPCSSRCNRSHVCSFCGGPHPALSWSCRRAPNPQP